MIKSSILSIAVAFMFFGCGSSDSDVLIDSSGLNDSSGATDNTKKINLWSYFVPDKSITLSFDKMTTTDGVVTSTAIGNFSSEYKFINQSEVIGPWRGFKGLYSIKNEDSLIKFSFVGDKTASSYVSGSFKEDAGINSSLFMDATGRASYSTTFAGTSKSYSSDSGNCFLNKFHNTITLYDGYSYQDVLELKCEHKITQSYSKDGSSFSIRTPQIAYEYYQKNIGWIAKVDKDCIVKIKEDYEFIDDVNETCIKTRTTYQLLHK